MTRTKSTYRCVECAAAHPKWTGQCPTCSAWNSLVDDLDTPSGGMRRAAAVAQPITEVATLVAGPVPTGDTELDRVLGGGLVPGSVTLLGGEPGIGKSTLLLQVLASWPGRSLYVSAEESEQQVRLRAERLGALRPELWLLAETALPHIVDAIDRVQPSLVVVDSVQTVFDPDLGSAPGSVTQVRDCAHRLVGLAKQRGIPVLLVGHVTKDGTLAGPRVLEHVVDTVLAFEGDRHHALRLLRAVKHRFGATDELGVFEMAGTGLVGVPDASRLFLADRRVGVPGSAVSPTVDGQRPLLVEVQALTMRTDSAAPPRRSAQGIDGGRLALLLAVLEQRARLPMAQHEVYSSVVGGVRLTEPGADLAICLSIASALMNRPLPPDVVAIGEIGLAGEVRQAGHTPRRLAEAARMGFRRAIVPANSASTHDGIAVVPVTTISEALTAVGLSADCVPRGGGRSPAHTGR
ncbi:MAG: DNA repair protein RadA [Ilumatobacteraceae bacterium]